MASVSPDKLEKTKHDELCVAYAAMMLHDDGLEINVSPINPIFKRFVLGREIG